MESLSREELVAASRLVAERIRNNYDPYLGRAAELIGTGECRNALDVALLSAPDHTASGNIARNILFMGKSDEAVSALKSIVQNRSLFWGVRNDALVNLKIALDSSSDNRPMSEFIPPDFELVIFDAVCDDDYLVRYHAAETLLKAAGVKSPLSDMKELFGFICGNRATDSPDEADREGFRKAAEIIRGMLKKSK
jgi:hypothetical protein